MLKNQMRQSIQKKKQPITYQNKDVVSKLFAEQMKNRSFSVYGIDFVYFDCAEPTARMLRASLAEDESHLHGRLSQVKFDNTSVC